MRMKRGVTEKFHQNTWQPIDGRDGFPTVSPAGTPTVILYLSSQRIFPGMGSKNALNKLWDELVHLP